MLERDKAFAGKRLLFSFLVGYLIVTFPNLFASEIAPLLEPISSDQWLIVLNDPRSERHRGWKSNRYQSSANYQNDLAIERLTRAILKDHPVKLITNWPIESIHVHCLVVTIPKSTRSVILANLSKDKRVKWVQRQQIFEAKSLPKNSDTSEKSLIDKKVNKIDNDPYFKLQNSFKKLNLLKVKNSFNGQGVKIAMVDSGVDSHHPELQNTLVEQIDFVNLNNKNIPAEHHGTAVAGIMIAKRNNGVGISGIAPSARLYAYRGCWENKNGATRCETLTLARALDRVVKVQPDVLNLSLTGPKDPLLERLLDEVIANGTKVIAAFDPDRLANDRFPLSRSGVMLVDALSDKNDNLSSQLFAPGRKILTTQPGNTYDFVSGSSMATANMSSVLALILQAVPDSELDNISQLIRSQKDHSNKKIVTDVCRLIHRLKQSSNPLETKLNCQ